MDIREELKLEHLEKLLGKSPKMSRVDPDRILGIGSQDRLSGRKRANDFTPRRAKRRDTTDSLEDLRSPDRLPRSQERTSRARLHAKERNSMDIGTSPDLKQKSKDRKSRRTLSVDSQVHSALGKSQLLAQKAVGLLQGRSSGPTSRSQSLDARHKSFELIEKQDTLKGIKRMESDHEKEIGNHFDQPVNSDDRIKSPQGMRELDAALAELSLDMKEEEYFFSDEDENFPLTRDQVSQFEDHEREQKHTFKTQELQQTPRQLTINKGEGIKQNSVESGLLSPDRENLVGETLIIKPHSVKSPISLHASMRDFLPNEMTKEKLKGAANKVVNEMKDIITSKMGKETKDEDGDYEEEERDDPPGLASLEEETQEQYIYDDDIGPPMQHIPNILEDVEDTLDTLVEDKQYLEEKIVQMEEKHKQEIEYIMEARREDRAKWEADVEVRDRELDILQKENREKEEILAGWEASKSALRDSAIQNSELKEQIHQLTSELQRKEIQAAQKLEEWKIMKEKLREIESELESYKKMVGQHGEEALGRKREEDSLRRCAARIGNKSQEIKKTSSVTSLANRQILALDDDYSSSSSNEDSEEEEPSRSAKSLTDKEARRALKEYQWPKLSNVGNFEQFRRMISQNVKMAQMEGIPDEMIKKNLMMHLVANESASMGRLSGTSKVKTLKDVLKLLRKMDAKENSLRPEERYKAVKPMGEEMGVDYIYRLEGMFTDMFGKHGRGKNRMVKEQFLQTFQIESMSLTRQERQHLEAYSDLVDFAIAAERMLKEKVKRAKMAEANKSGPNFKNQQNRQPYSAQQSQINGSQGAVPKRNQMAIQSLADDNTMEDDGTIGINAVAQDRAQTFVQRRSAGPNAKRVTMEEYSAGKTRTGEKLCYKCAQAGHIVPTPCVFYPYCLICQGETRHSTKHHDEFMDKEQTRKREAAMMANAGE